MEALLAHSKNLEENYEYVRTRIPSIVPAIYEMPLERDAQKKPEENKDVYEMIEKMHKNMDVFARKLNDIAQAQAPPQTDLVSTSPSVRRRQRETSPQPLTQMPPQSPPIPPPPAPPTIQTQLPPPHLPAPPNLPTQLPPPPNLPTQLPPHHLPPAPPSPPESPIEPYQVFERHPSQTRPERYQRDPMLTSQTVQLQPTTSQSEQPEDVYEDIADFHDTAADEIYEDTIKQNTAPVPGAFSTAAVTGKL